MKTLKLQTKTWHLIQASMRKEYCPSFFFREKMKNKLGFTVREHNAWIENKNYHKECRDYQHAQDSENPVDILLSLPPSRGTMRTEIHLDFYSENKRTMFLLKYSEELATDAEKYSF